jgi:nucleobase:cation symporter-1, NCS1 family
VIENAVTFHTEQTMELVTFRGESKFSQAVLSDDLLHSSLYSKDLAPTPSSERTWTAWNYAALWISMCHCLPTYALCGSLVTGGMNWFQALITIGLGNIIVLVPILLIAQPGTKYGIPFPVLARSAFGTWGANVPAMLRAIVACGVSHPWTRICRGLCGILVAWHQCLPGW